MPSTAKGNDGFVSRGRRGRIAEALLFYNRQQPGLGDQFLVEVLAAIERIQALPDAWPRLTPRVRRYRMRRFPYGVLYHARGDALLIVAIAHTHRRPMYWRERLA